ncbi:uncharacterized protein EV420DRAFT_225976 [Desarmillaria tabescens]|uniref:NACHT domain-containing protein n=1 Tax=Armillaria tabescens TaxID=1929756 RepID=A0AA39TJ22_ARMTA|nr:uncharacterized protein EV420DRAFT_225976 [Desarmillaria tabescens]KAK0460692.1 hypothetical protein EV420DRAFT_225976 [Desarmillaria tabescens]
MGLRTLFHQCFPPHSDSSNTMDAQSLLREIFKGLKATFEVLHTVFEDCPVPGVKAFLGICCDTMSMLETGMVNKHDSQELYILIPDINDRFSRLLQQYIDLPEDLRDRVAVVVSRTEEFHPELQKILEKGTLRRAFTASDDRALIARYLKRVKDALDMVTTEAALHAAIDTSFLVNNSLFGALECVHDASWNAASGGSECTEGTRSEILYKFSSWLDNISQPQIFWINGMAGTGKTSLAKSMARIVSNTSNVLWGSFFCSRRNADRRDIRRIIPSIAFHLAAANGAYCRQVLKVVRNSKLGFVRMPPPEQWEKLIVKPLQDSGLDSSPILIVVDGLDECDNLDKDGWLPLWKQILGSLSDLPGLKVLVTSRPNDVTRVHSPLRNVSVIDLHTFHCETDIQFFVRECLAKLGTSNPPQWPSDEHVSQIAKQSDHLFVYAAEICRHVESPGSPEQQLNKLLENNSGSGLLVGMVRFYGRILASALRFLNDEKIEECRAILGMLVLQKEPTLSLHDLSILLEHDVSHVRGLLTGFHSVLLIPTSNNEPVTVFHPSFTKFITSHDPWKGICDVDGCERRQCQDHPLLHFPQFYVGAKQYHLNITMTLLRFMIPNISSQGYGPHISLSTRRPNQRPSSALEYACRHWSHHLQLSSSDEQQDIRALADILARFLKERGKDWIDVMCSLSYECLLESVRDIELADTWRQMHSSLLSSSMDQYLKQQLNILRSSAISSVLPGGVPAENAPQVQFPTMHPETLPQKSQAEELEEWPCWLRPANPSSPCVQMPEPDLQAGSYLSADSFPGIMRMGVHFPSWGHGERVV